MRRIKTILISILLLPLLACTGQQPLTRAQLNPLEQMEQGSLVEEFGIQARSLRLSAEGRMLDFRYKVLDPDKASKVITRNIHPYIVGEKQDTKIGVQTAKTGEMRHTGNNLKVGKQYFVLFGNPKQQIKKGDQVTVVIGDYRMEHVMVD